MQLREGASCGEHQSWERVKWRGEIVNFLTRPALEFKVSAGWVSSWGSCAGVNGMNWKVNSWAVFYIILLEVWYNRMVD